MTTFNSNNGKRNLKTTTNLLQCGSAAFLVVERGLQGPGDFRLDVDFKRTGGEGGLYCSIFHNSLRFCHFTRNTHVFWRLLPSLSGRIRLSNAFPSLLRTSKMPKKSNMSNKPGFPCWVYQDSARFQSVLGESYRLNTQSQASSSCPK